MQKRISPEDLQQAEKAITEKVFQEGYSSLDGLEWNQIFKAVKSSTSMKDYQRISDTTKEALSNIRSRELKKQHRDYMETNQWEKRRKEKLEKENHECERCGDTATQAHHTSYRNFNSSNKQAEIDDLMALCRECHRKVEGLYQPQKQSQEQLSEKEQVKSRIKFNSKYKQDLQSIKYEEKNSEEGLSNGRRRWINQEIQEVQDRLTELNQELQEM